MHAGKMDADSDILQAAQLQKTIDLLSIIQLHSALASGAPAAQALNLLENEAMAVFSAVEALIGPDSENKTAVVQGLLNSDGEWQGVSCKHYCSCHAMSRRLY